MSFMASGSLANMSATIGVLIVPGHTIDANSSGGIFERSTLSQPDHSVLGCMVHCSAGDADQAANRRVVHDHATSLFAHLEQLILHATPNATKIDRIHAVEFLAAGISGFCNRTLH